MGKLQGNVVIVTGASSGIGLETAKAFAREGCRLALGARKEDRLEVALRQVEAEGGEAFAQVTDVQDEEQVRALIEGARTRWGRVDILVNNAGYGTLKPFIEMSTEEIRDQFETNVLGAVYATKVALEDMVPRREGHIINVASVAAKVPAPNYGAYSATKAALDSLSTSLRAELHTHNIKVTVIHPSVTNTRFWETSLASDDQEKERGAQHLNRLFMQQPETVARAIVRAAKNGKPEVYPQLGTQLLPVFRAFAPRLIRLALRGMARVYR